MPLAISPIVSVSVQFPDLSQHEFDEVRAQLTRNTPGRIVLPHPAHRWYTSASEPETVAALVAGLRAALESRPLSFDDEEALDDVSQEYTDWLEESAAIDDDDAGADAGPIVSFSVHLPALDHDDFAALLQSLRAAHPRRIVLGEQRGHSHVEVSDRHTIASRMPGLRAALQGQPLPPAHAAPLVALLHDYADWLTNQYTGSDGSI